MPEERKVWMAKKVANRWVRAVAFPEYRVKILFGTEEYKNIVNLMYAFRDGKVAMQSMPQIPDLGVSQSFDGMELWSKDYEGLKKLGEWFEQRGFETTGVW